MSFTGCSCGHVHYRLKDSMRVPAFYHSYFLIFSIKICMRMFLNGSQLAKMKKNIPDMSLPWNWQGWSSWSKKLQIYLKSYDLCEYVKFGAISWKFDILSITASNLKILLHMCDTYYCDYLQHSTAHFVST